MLSTKDLVISRISLLLSALHYVLVMRPKVGTSAVDSLAAICRMDPKVSMPLLLAILFFNRYFAKNRSDSHVMLLKLMGVIPSLASHSVMMPLVLQTILPMLQKDAKPVLYATAVRVLCKTWEVTDRAFGSLQGVLQPKAFSEFVSERNICISMAASVRDVCKGSPDRGVDLILSVSACIESQDPTVQSLGFESLAHLCEADVVDFYTAWDVIAKPLANYSAHPIVAYSLCILLRWGAMDVEAYPETSKTIMQILWDIATSRIDCSTLWVKARISALESLANYEVEHIQRSITDFNRGNLETLISEENLGVLGALERLEVKIITYEYMTRRRLLKEKRIPVNKVGKLLDVFPRVIFSSGKGGNVKDLPGAALLSLSFHSKSMHVQQSSKLHGGYVNALMEIADSLQLSRNIMIALLSLQSWKSFMHRWIRAISMDSNSLGINSEGANDILMSLLTTAEESLPQSVENIALAIGAFCMVLPPSAHAVTSSASKFLLKWLFQYEHEHRQWTSAISLGQMSRFLHVTDSRQKFQIISGLLEVAANSKSTLVKGACGVGLGFTCQDLLTRVETGHKTHNSNLEEGSTVLREAVLVRKIVMALCAMISQLCPSSFDSLQRLCEHFQMDEDDIFTEEFSNMPFNNCDHLEEDVWGIAGLVLGLGNSVIAMYRTGAHDAVLKLKDVLISWIPHVNTLVQGAVCTEEGRQEVPLSVGSCLVLPTVVSLCQKAELIDHKLDNLIMGYKGLISELLDTTNKYGTLHQSLLMASCIGTGNLISSISTEGVYSMKADDVKSLLELMRKAYSHPNPPTIHLGGMIGVVNSMGAGAGALTHLFPQPSTLETTHVQKESSLIRGPILSSPICEQLCTSLMQEMFLAAQDSKDWQMQKYAAWAVAFLRQRWWSNEFQNVNSSISNAVETKPVSQNFAEDSLVWQISLWLMNLNISELEFQAGMIPHVNTVTTVLRCLSQAPRLPALDWGAIVRRLMKYEDQAFAKLKPDPTLKKGALREGCIYFSIVHGNQVESLIVFLDEICDLSRFRTLELRLQSCLLLHLGELRKIFSDSRLEKLFDDLLDYFSSPSSPYQANNAVDKSLLRVSLWNGLHECLAETSSSSLQYISNMEKCMELLFCLLPAVLCSNCPGLEETSSEKEWLEAVRCLGRAPPGWLTDFLQVPLPEMDLLKGSHSIEIAKRIKAKARLVRTGCIPLSELGRLKPALLNTGFDGIWNVLLEVFVALNQAEGSIKRQWLLDAVEISCITEYPSPALQFLGLLSSSWCKYMPLLIVDRFYVLADLPVTLPSLLSDSSWRAITETIIQNLWASMERIYAWAGHVDEGGEFLSAEPIHVSENSMSVFLRRVMYHTCFALKDHLPFEKQLRLANMVVP